MLVLVIAIVIAAIYIGKKLDSINNIEDKDISTRDYKKYQ